MTRPRWDQAAYLARTVLAVGCLVLLVFVLDEGHLRSSADPTAAVDVTANLLPEVRPTW